MDTLRRVSDSCSDFWAILLSDSVQKTSPFQACVCLWLTLDELARLLAGPSAQCIRALGPYLFPQPRVPFLVSCCQTNYSKAQWPERINIYYLTVCRLWNQLHTYSWSCLKATMEPGRSTVKLTHTVVGKPQFPVTWTASRGCHTMRAYSTGTSKPERVPEVSVFAV